MSTERGAGGSGQPGAAEMEILLRRVERERQARKQAEQLLEHKSRELYEANQQLQAQAARLELTVQERTRALEEALEAMQDALRAKGEFLAVVSHEIRTPMNGVLGMAQLLQLTELNEEQRRYCDTIQTSGETLLAIINDILDMSKMDSGKVRLDVRPLQPRQVAREVADLLGAQAQSKSLYLDIEVAGDVPEWVYGDATRLKRGPEGAGLGAAQLGERALGVVALPLAAVAGVGVADQVQVHHALLITGPTHPIYSECALPAGRGGS